MPKMAAPTTTAREPKIAMRVPSPRSRRRARFRSAQSVGSRRYGNGCVVTRRGRSRSQHFLDLLKAGAARELEEDGGELLVLTAGQGQQLVHGAAGDDLAAQDDADAVAHLLGHLEGMRAHQDGHAPPAHEPEDVLDEAAPPGGGGPPGVGPEHAAPAG